MSSAMSPGQCTACGAVDVSPVPTEVMLSLKVDMYTALAHGLAIVTEARTTTRAVRSDCLTRAMLELSAINLGRSGR